MGQVTAFFGTVTSVSVDVVILLVAVAILVALGLAQGKSTLIALIVSVYPAILLTETSPLSFAETYTKAVPMRAVLLMAIMAITFFVLRAAVICHASLNPVWKFFEVLTLAICLTGLVVAALYHVADIERYYTFSIMLQKVIVSPEAWFAWLAAPFASMVLLVRV